LDKIERPNREPDAVFYDDFELWFEEMIAYRRATEFQRPGLTKLELGNRKICELTPDGSQYTLIDEIYQLYENYLVEQILLGK